MQVSINSTLKLIKIDENVNAKELFEFFEKLLPDNGPLGSWKEYKIEAKEILNYWPPFTFGEPNPSPINPMYGKWEVTCGETPVMEINTNTPYQYKGDHGYTNTTSGTTDTLN